MSTHTNIKARTTWQSGGMHSRFRNNRRFRNHVAYQTRNGVREPVIYPSRFVVWQEDRRERPPQEEWDRVHFAPNQVEDRTRITAVPDCGMKHRAFGFPANIRLCIESNSPFDTVGYAVNEENGIVALKVNGKIETCGSVPEKVYEFSRNQLVRLVTLGSCGRFFLLFGNGSIGCTGNKLKKIATENQVRCVAFGKTNGLVLFEDGRYNDSGLPNDLRELISGWRIPHFISMGPRNEYFIRFHNGEWVAHAPDANVQVYIDRLQRREKLVRTMVFGKKSVIVTYDDA